VEEVGRIVGYDRLPARVPDGPLPLAESHPLETFRERLRDALVGMGLQDTVSYSLIDPAWLGRLTAEGAPIAPEPLRVTNPTSPAQSVARPTLRPSVLDVARRNLRHRAGVAVFEIAPVYLPRRGDLPDERWTAAIALAGRATQDSWLGPARDFDLWDLEAILGAVSDRLHAAPSGASEPAPGLHPGRSERRVEGGITTLAWGQLDPRVADLWELPTATFVAEIDVAALLAAAKPALAVPPPRYPPAIRDVAVVVDEATPYGAVERAVRAAGKDLVEDVTLVDLYRGPQVGEGKKSFAMRVVLRSGSGTLTDADVDRVQKRVEGRLLHELGATLRA
jgi:phenylalanyl-tRNA synthetase beta chain